MPLSSIWARTEVVPVLLQHVPERACLGEGHRPLDPERLAHVAAAGEAELHCHMRAARGGAPLGGHVQALAGEDCRTSQR
eukprot:1342096-Pyramimonas_sp.AAC.1